MVSKYQYGIWQKYIESPVFLITIIFLMILGFYNCAYLNTGEYLNNWIEIFKSPWIFSSAFFTLFFLNDLYILSYFDKNIFLKLRMKGQKEYQIESIKTIFLFNQFLFLITIFVFAILLQLFFIQIKITPYEFYSVSNLSYLCFSLIKIYAVTELFALINVLLYKLLPHFLVFALNAYTIYLLLTSYNFTWNPIEEIKDFKINPAFYIKEAHYASFMHEISFTILYVICLYILVCGLFMLWKKKEEKV